MAEPKITIYPEPREVWMKASGGHNPSLFRLIGETSRSYLCASSWRPRKLAKSQYTIVPADEAVEMRWAISNRWRIAVAISNGRHDAATLRKIAELIGYTEAK